MDPEPAPVPRPTLRLTRVEKRYPCFTFGPIDLELAPGVTLGLLGENGAGKSSSRRRSFRSRTAGRWLRRWD